MGKNKNYKCLHNLVRVENKAGICVTGTTPDTDTEVWRQEPDT